MIGMKTLSAALILSAAIVTPAFAQDGGMLGPGNRNGLTPQPGQTYQHHRAYRQAYNRWNGPADAKYRRNKENFGFSGRDPSRVGGESPSLHPSAVLFADGCFRDYHGSSQPAFASRRIHVR
jgi:hypothetical protein